MNRIFMKCFHSSILTLFTSATLTASVSSWSSTNDELLAKLPKKEDPMLILSTNSLNSLYDGDLTTSVKSLSDCELEISGLEDTFIFSLKDNIRFIVNKSGVSLFSSKGNLLNLSSQESTKKASFKFQSTDEIAGIAKQILENAANYCLGNSYFSPDEPGSPYRKVTELLAPKPDSDLTPLVMIMPRVPIKLARKGVPEGFVQVLFNVKSDGAVSNLFIGDTDINSAELNKEVIRAVKKWKYKVNDKLDTSSVYFTIIEFPLF